jgi:hypothetical protein
MEYFLSATASAKILETFPNFYEKHYQINIERRASRGAQTYLYSELLTIGFLLLTFRCLFLKR